MNFDIFLVLSLIVLIAAFIQGSTSVGFGLICTPMIAILRPELLPVCVLMLMLPLNFYVLWRERGAVDRVGTSWVTGGRIVGTAGGILVLAVLSADHLSFFIGAATILAALVTLIMPPFSPSRSAYIVAGLITGVTETATGIGGPPLALLFQHRSPATMRSTIALCFLIGEVVSLLTLTATGRISNIQLCAAALLMPALVAGLVLSHVVHHRISSRFLRNFVQIFAVVSGLVLMVQASR